MSRKANLTDEHLEIIAEQIDRIMEQREQLDDKIIKTVTEAKGQYEPGTLDFYLISGALDDLYVHYDIMLNPEVDEDV